MQPDQTGRLPLQLVPEPVAGETVPSYAARIDETTGGPLGHLWHVAVSAYLEREGLPAQSHVRNEIAEGAVLEACHEMAGSSASQVAVLGQPMKAAWHACLLCTAGTVIAIHPREAQLVCRLHHAWTGPTKVKPRQPLWAVPQPAPTHSLPVEYEIEEAAVRIHSSNAIAPIIQEILRRGASAVRHEWDGVSWPEDLPTAAAILDTVTDANVIRAVCNPYMPYAEAYEVVVRRMEQASNPSGDAGSDQAWLMLRWTAAAARHRWAGEWNIEDPAPLIEPVRPEHSFSGSLQPFHSYLDCVRTNGRNDQQWWNDHFRMTASNPRYLCSEGHVLLRRPPKDYQHGRYASSCSICTGRRVIPGNNSLADVMPWLADEWDHSAGPGPSPWTVRPGSNRMGHWICLAKHHYPATFANRALRGSGCPYCYRKVLAGTNDLATTHPELARLWDPDAANTKTTQQISARNSIDRIVWRCPQGHQFVRTPAKLVEYGGRCQTCTGRILVPGINDLATKRPDVAAQWNYDRNGTLKPDHVKPGTEKVVWWVCPNGHEFLAKVRNRCHYPKLTCPVESGRILVPGVNDIATREPRLALEWDNDLNGRRPDEIVPGTSKYYWTCPAGHTQYTPVAGRRRAGGCTTCPPSTRAIPKEVKNHLHAWDGQ